MPAVTALYARRTGRVAELVRLLGHAAGGRPAERLMTRLGMPASDDTILRHLKRQVGCASTQPLLRVVGIDYWSWIKGSTSGCCSTSEFVGVSHHAALNPGKVSTLIQDVLQLLERAPPSFRESQIEIPGNAMAVH